MTLYRHKNELNFDRKDVIKIGTHDAHVRLYFCAIQYSLRYIAPMLISRSTEQIAIVE